LWGWCRKKKKTPPPPPTPNPRVVEPTCHRIPGKAEHAAAGAVDLGDQRIVDAVEQASERLGAVALAKRARERFGQRRKAGDIGKQRCAVSAVG
jgi:hypothetical protein